MSRVMAVFRNVSNALRFRDLELTTATLSVVETSFHGRST
jgi:hypothetical protein